MILFNPLIIIGPTASGKSSLALDIATHINSSIINADSQQVYKGLDLLTAQPLAEEMKKVPHHLYQYVDLDEPYSVARWLKDAYSIFENLEKRALFVGGTGFYINALLNGLSPIPPIPAEIRLKIRTLTKECPDQLYEILQSTDPVIAPQLNSKDTQRIARALEVKETTGQSLLYWQGRKPIRKNFGVPLIIAFLPDAPPQREELYHRINTRTEKMMAEGATTEVGRILSHSPNLGLDRKAIGIKEIISYLKKEISKESMIQKIQEKTRQYAKRQMTWIRHQLTPHLVLKTVYKKEMLPEILEKIRHDKIYS